MSAVFTPRHRHVMGRLLVVLALLAVTSPSRAVATPEEDRLAVQYAPTLRIDRPATTCGDGNGHLPIAVRAVVEQPDVVLVTRAGRRIRSAPTVAQLAAAASDTALDLPGTARTGSCELRRIEQQRVDAGIGRTVYARVVRDPEASQLLYVQYWMYYLAHDWLSTHEGDWQLVQLEFATPDPADAMARGPESVTVAQHDYAETQPWSAIEVRDRTHPLIFPAVGSNAGQFVDGVFLRSPRGCDVTRSAATDLALPVTVLPSDPARAVRDVGWLAFPGRWGAFTGADAAGPVGPAFLPQWVAPWRWAHETARASVRVPSRGVIAAPAATTLCGAIAAGDRGLRAIRGWSSAVQVLVVGVLLLVLLTLLIRGWRTLRSQSVGVVPMATVAAGTAMVGLVGGMLQWMSGLFTIGSFGAVMDTVAVVAAIVVPCVTFALLNAAAIALTSDGTPARIGLVGALRRPLRTWRRSPLHTRPWAVVATLAAGLLAVVVSHALAMAMTVATGWPFWVALPLAALFNSALLGATLLVMAAHRRERAAQAPPPTRAPA